MSNKKLSELIIRYLNDITTDAEREELVGYLEDPIIREDFKKYLSLNYFIIKDASQFEYKYPLRKAIAKIEKEKQQKGKVKIIRMRSVLKYAAAVVLILGSSYFFRDVIFNNPDQNVPTIVNTNTIEPGTDKATLTLGDGSHIVLEKGNGLKTQNANSNGEKIVYEAGKTKSKEIEYNYLTIPRGGQYHIVLSDKTEVWLNSESQLKYPVIFIEGETREVELVYGEAYFDVSPSTEHQGSEFKVLNQSQVIEVLGTEFNLKAYKDEDNIYTTLVEGKVAINLNGEKQNLSPDQQSQWNPSTNSFSLNTDVNVYNEVSWKDGIFSFDGKSLKEIMKIMSRWYDVEVIFADKKIEDTEFVGVLRKNKKLEDIIINIKTFGIIKDYEINENIVILK